MPMHMLEWAQMIEQDEMELRKAQQKWKVYSYSSIVETVTSYVC